MKDVELVAQLLLLIEEGPKGYSSDELDVAFNNREAWDRKHSTENEFRDVIKCIQSIFKTEEELYKSRLQNQADFHSLFGGVLFALQNQNAIDPSKAAQNLRLFFNTFTIQDQADWSDDQKKYYEHARVASNRTTARKERCEIISKLLTQ